jgi:DNA-directed RNA polymerase specialized sigma24 family protein
VIRRKLHGASAIRALYDSTDFASDVWKSLAAKSDRFDFPNVAALMAFLTQAAEQKLIDEQRRLHTQKRDIGRVRPISGLEGEAPGDLASADPTPSQFAQAREVREWLLAGQPDQARLVIELRDQGYGNEEIAERTGWHVRKVQRFLKDLKDLHDSWRG